MNIHAQACNDFSQDISAFVDDQLDAGAVGRLVEHMRGCTACQGYVDALRELSAIHRQGANSTRWTTEGSTTASFRRWAFLWWPDAVSRRSIRLIPRRSS